MLVLFCADPLAPRRPDPAYAREVAAVEALSVRYRLIGFEALLDGDGRAAVRRVPPADAGEVAVYRGWMLRPERYRLLYEALAERGVRLVNDPDAYAFAHLFPNGYAAIAAHTPCSVWLATEGDIDMDAVMAALRPFGDRPVVVKDFVKSRKHEWAEACFIPDASNRAAVERVVRRFLSLQGPDLAGGLVFREFVPLAPLGRHPQSGMPLGREYRWFCLDGAPAYGAPCWDQAPDDEPPPPPDWLPAVLAAVRSRCFTLDLAQRAGGAWLVMELGDGQVAGLPARADPVAFYRALVGRLADGGARPFA